LRGIRYAAIVLTLVLLVVRPWIPPKVLQLHPQPSTQLNIYSDEWDLGESRITWQDPATFSAECTLRDGAPYPFCGVAVKFFDRAKIPQASLNQSDAEGITAVDLSRFDGLRLDIGYGGNAPRLRFALRNVEFPLTKTLDLQRAKQLEAYIEADEYGKPVYIDFDLLNVSDWWITQNAIRRENTRPAFDRIMEMIVHLPSQTPKGPHFIQIRQIDAVGEWLPAAELYPALVGFWVVFILMELLWRALRIGREKERIDRLFHSLEQDYRDLEATAYSDPLTGLLNRSGLERFMNALRQTPTESPYWLCVLDIEGFKSLNAHHSPREGDQLLCDISRWLQSQLQSHEALARWGGDEFVLLCGHGNRQDIYRRCQQLCAAVGRERFTLSDKPLSGLKLNFGICRWQQGSLAETIQAAHLALQAAKRAGAGEIALAYD
jgi:diguanylate cyclase (GGDEF)-like protein